MDGSRETKWITTVWRGVELAPHKFADYIGWLNSELDKIPPDYRSHAILAIVDEECFSSEITMIKISYPRPETDEEMKQRGLHVCYWDVGALLKRP